jgi:hypothetical protein
MNCKVVPLAGLEIERGEGRKNKAGEFATLGKTALSVHSNEFTSLSASH